MKLKSKAHRASNLRVNQLPRIRNIKPPFKFSYEPAQEPKENSIFSFILRLRARTTLTTMLLQSFNPLILFVTKQKIPSSVPFSPERGRMLSSKVLYDPAKKDLFSLCWAELPSPHGSRIFLHNSRSGSRCHSHNIHNLRGIGENKLHVL